MNKIAYQMTIVLVLLVSISSLVSAQAKDITIDQKNKTFVLEHKVVKSIAINSGDTIHFMNNDPWFHNVYSLSQSKTFDLGSYPQGESRPVTFERKGSYKMECAIHSNMSLKVIVK